MSHLESIRVSAESSLPSKYGNFKILSFRTASSNLCEQPHLALIIDHGLHNSIENGDSKTPLVRVHSECITGDVFRSLRCDCGNQLDDALCRIAAHGSGAVVYLRQEGRGIGIENKLRAYKLQENGFDTADANIELGLPVDAREYATAGLILESLGINQCELLTNNPNKVIALKKYGIKITKVIPLLTANNHHLCQSYLNTKREKMGHRI